MRLHLANLGELQPRAVIAEFDINQRPLDIAEALLARAPKILGLGVYIWNVTETTEVVATIKRVRPEIKIILGGPEVSYETDSQEIVRLADHVITGEADLKFAEVCRTILERRAGVQALACPDGTLKRELQLPKIIPAELPDFSRITLPYEFYTDADIAHRIVYVEASRGCPFTCEFCLSSLDVRYAPCRWRNFSRHAKTFGPRPETIQVRGSYLQSQHCYQQRHSRIFPRAPPAGQFLSLRDDS